MEQIQDAEKEWATKNWSPVALAITPTSSNKMYKWPALQFRVLIDSGLGWGVSISVGTPPQCLRGYLCCSFCDGPPWPCSRPKLFDDPLRLTPYMSPFSPSHRGCIPPNLWSPKPCHPCPMLLGGRGFRHTSTWAIWGMTRCPGDLKACTVTLYMSLTWVFVCSREEWWVVHCQVQTTIKTWRSISWSTMFGISIWETNCQNNRFQFF